MHSVAASLAYHLLSLIPTPLNLEQIGPPFCILASFPSSTAKVSINLVEVHTEEAIQATGVVGCQRDMT